MADNKILLPGLFKPNANTNIYRTAFGIAGLFVKFERWGYTFYIDFRDSHKIVTITEGNKKPAVFMRPLKEWFIDGEQFWWKIPMNVFEFKRDLENYNGLDLTHVSEKELAEFLDNAYLKWKETFEEVVSNARND